jgi:hypothetical protein
MLKILSERERKRENGIDSQGIDPLMGAFIMGQIVARIDFFFFFETGSCYVPWTSLELLILLPQPSESWNYRHSPHASEAQLIPILKLLLKLPKNH